MQIALFQIPVCGGERLAELNAFLASHEVRHCERHLLVQPGQSASWCFLIEYLGASAVAAVGDATAKDRPRVDYRELLNDADFAVFARLREVRKALAQQAGIPPYAVFTNEQLAAMVQQRVHSEAALAAIVGVGGQKAARYAAHVLPALRAADRP